MRNKAIVILFFILLAVFSVRGYGAIPPAEREALIALYNSTNGDNWLNNDGWKTPPLHTDGFAVPGTEEDWNGITLTDLGDHVKKIILRINNLEGTIPAELGNLPNLETLDLYYNRLKENIPPDIGNILNLTYLDLSVNELTGTIPAGLGDLSNLTYLDLHSNQLTGSIPSELDYLSNLIGLYLNKNKLTGSIPASFGNLTGLEKLYLNDNELSGNIPPELGDLSTNLQELILNGNKLTGIIPNELGSLLNLTGLYLHSNNLKGPIPTSLTNLTGLSGADIGYNALYTEDTGLITFLDIKDPDWKDTQTVAPENITAVYIDSTTVEVSWDPITYRDDPGGYLVSYSTTPGGPYDLYDNITDDKKAESIEVTGLTQDTTYHFVVKTQTNSHGSNKNTVESEYSGEYELKAPTEPAVMADDPFNTTCSKVVIAGNVTDNGRAKVTERGVCWSTSENPEIGAPGVKKTSCETGGIGAFEIEITGLSAGTTYYARAYATNFKGTAYNDVDKVFITLPPCLPEVNTTLVSEETCTTAISGGEVTDEGGVEVYERGVCWSTSPEPGPNLENYGDNKTADGSGAGTFTSEITGLTENTFYYVRAYATNSKGTEFGEEVNFSTVEPGKITVTTDEVANITCTRASCGGNVVDNCGGTAITGKGVCWSTSPNPTTDDSTASGGTDAGSFTGSLTGLSQGTTYYVRAYAISNGKTTYDEENEKIFTTEAEGNIIVTTNEVADAASKTAVCGGNVVDDCNVVVDEKGVCWSTFPNPGIGATDVEKVPYKTGGTGPFEIKISGLAPDTTYYVRAYALSSGIPYYGGNKEFKTTPKIIKPPTVVTAEVTDKTTTTAVCGGNVIDDGGVKVTERGVCWSTSKNPTIKNNDGATNDGSGTGAFTSEITGLTPGTTYYVRAYATNSKGTSYGESKKFETVVEISEPTVVTAEVTNVTTKTAVCGGNVTDNGGAKVTERGVCWSTFENPTLNHYDGKTTDGSGTGTFTGEITGLTPGTKYYVRAYAINSAGTNYGENKAFETLNKFTISGRVTISIGTGIAGLPGVNLEFSSGGENSVEVTDSNGYYEHDVNYGWSGTVTPSKKRYTFSPSRQPYNMVTINKRGQDFTATADSPAISGRVTISTVTGTAGFPGVTLKFIPDSGETEIETTNDDGYYIHPVDFGWSGAVTAEKTGYYIKPVGHDAKYDGVTSDKPDQNYTATDDRLPVISGRVTISKDTGIEGFAGVTMLFSPGSGASETKTNVEGYYERQVERGWTGTVTPKKTGYHFNPLSQSYNNVDTNRTGQNFTAAEGSVALSIEAARLEEKKMMISKEYVKITVKLDNIEGDLEISGFMILRKEPGSTYIELIPVEELQKSIPETFYDWDIKKNKSYIYKVEARDKQGKAIGVSDETKEI